MSNLTVKKHLPLIITFTLIFAVRLTVVFTLPFGQVISGSLEGLNDEPAHLNYIKHIAEHRSFPILKQHFREPGALAHAEYEYFQPPFYYLICSPFYILNPTVLLPRLLSFACGIASLFLLYRIMLILQSGRTASIAATAFLGILPTHVYFCSVTSNDPLCWLIALALIYFTLEIGTRPDHSKKSIVRSSAAIGVLLTIGLLTKASILLFYPIVSLAFIFAAIRYRNPEFLLGGVLAIGGSIILASPWYLRNLHLYGSLLAVDTGFGPRGTGQTGIAGLDQIIRTTIRFFWYPMQNLPETIPKKILNLIGLGIIGIHTVLAFRYLKQKKQRQQPTVLMVLLLFLVLAAHIRINLIWGEPEARHLFPALAPMIWLFCIPIFDLLKKWERGSTIALIWIFAVSLYPYLYLTIV